LKKGIMLEKKSERHPNDPKRIEARTQKKKSIKKRTSKGKKKRGSQTRGRKPGDNVLDRTVQAGVGARKRTHNYRPAIADKGKWGVRKKNGQRAEMKKNETKCAPGWIEFAVIWRPSGVGC